MTKNKTSPPSDIFTEDDIWINENVEKLASEIDYGTTLHLLKTQPSGSTPYLAFITGTLQGYYKPLYRHLKKTKNYIKFCANCYVFHLIQEDYYISVNTDEQAIDEYIREDLKYLFKDYNNRVKYHNKSEEYIFLNELKGFDL